MANPHPVYKPENLTAPRFKPGQSGNPNGKPRNRVAEYRLKIMGRKRAKAYFGIGNFEAQEWYEYLRTASTPELTTLAKDETAPVFARTYARAILFDMKAGKTTTIDKISEKLDGKATQRVEHTGADGGDLIPARTLTKEEARELMENLGNEY